ncbi:uncharacterized protein METZ01_LOCUS77557 [marine metagenome]|uniref:Uncharacterized protein n=1 Tax=marine metagenome TaxID=408172 RepID=A0A381UDI4_9ZZZZ
MLSSPLKDIGIGSVSYSEKPCDTMISFDRLAEVILS